MSDDSNNKVNLDEYRAQMSKSIVKEIFAIFTEEKKDHGEDFALELLMSIVVSILSTIIFRSLQSYSPSNNSDGRPEAILAAPFKQMRHAVQNSVASAFTGAILNYNPKIGSEFVCQVTKVPPVPSSLSH